MAAREPAVQNRCSRCYFVHTDERFSVCRDCGTPLEVGA